MALWRVMVTPHGKVGTRKVRVYILTAGTEPAAKALGVWTAGLEQAEQVTAEKIEDGVTLVATFTA